MRRWSRLAGTGEMVEAVDDRPHVALDVVEAVDARRRARSPDARAARGAGWRRRPTAAAPSASSRPADHEPPSPPRSPEPPCGARSPRGPAQRHEPPAGATSNSASVHGSDPWSVITRSTAAATQSPLSSPRSMSPAAIASRSAFVELAHDRRPGRRAVQQQQPPHSAAHHPLLQLGRGHHAQRHAVADVEQRRIGLHVESPGRPTRPPAGGRRRPTSTMPRRSSIGAAAAIDSRTDPASCA